MPHRPGVIRIALLVSKPTLEFGGGLIVNLQTPPNAADNRGDGLLVIDGDDGFLLVD